jgi:hypothetical protein
MRTPTKLGLQHESFHAIRNGDGPDHGKSPVSCPQLRVKLARALINKDAQTRLDCILRILTTVTNASTANAVCYSIMRLTRSFREQLKQKEDGYVL